MEELQKAVSVLGVREAARLVGVSHSNLTYWLHHGVPKWRAQEARKIIAKAERHARAGKVHPNAPKSGNARELSEK